MTIEKRLERCLLSFAVFAGAFTALIAGSVGLSVALYVVTLAAIAVWHFARFFWVTR